MRPEKTEEKNTVELNDNEKLVMDLLSKSSPMDLGALKTQSALSNKQWDKAIKGLRGHGLVNVEKTDDALLIEAL